MANLTDFEEGFCANYHNLSDFERLVVFLMLAPQVVPEGGDAVEPQAHADQNTGQVVSPGNVSFELIIHLSDSFQ